LWPTRGTASLKQPPFENTDLRLGYGAQGEDEERASGGLALIVEEDVTEQHELVSAALRMALAEKLQIDHGQLEGLDAEAAAAALHHFVVRSAGPEELPPWLEAQPADETRRELIAHGIRQALAYELGVHPQQLERMNVIGAAHALDRIRSRRVALRSASAPAIRVAADEDSRELIDRMLSESLAEQLELPPVAIAGLRSDLGAHILGVILMLRRRADAAALPAGVTPTAQERRDVVARVVRDAIAQDAEIHPRLLGSLDTTAAAVLLGRFAETRRTVEVLRSNIANDELTGALRRSAGEHQLQAEMARVRRLGQGRLTVAFLDIDALKSVNDSQGHEAGDRLLQALVSTIQRRIRSYDSVTRWGGDEFVIAFPQADRQSAESILREVKSTFQQETAQTFSYGLAELAASDDLTAIVARADAQLYEQKRGPAPESPDQLPPPAPPPERRSMLDRLRGR